MELDIQKQTYFAVKGISNIKGSSKKLCDYEIVDNEIKGHIEVELYYVTQNREDSFTTLLIEYQIFIDVDNKLNNISLKDLKIEVIEGQGVNCNYSLILNFVDEEQKQEVKEEPKKNSKAKKEKVKSDPIIETIENINLGLNDIGNAINTLEEVIEVEEKIILEKVLEIKQDYKEIAQSETIINESKKEQIEENYDQMLSDSLEKREHRIEIISTKDKGTKEDFLRKFNSTEENNFRIKTLRVSDEGMLDKISKEYKIPLNVLFKSYDKESKKVVIKINDNR